MTDHFAGLQIIDFASQPDTMWHGANAPYNNDTIGTLGDHWPRSEFVTSYDMSPYDPKDNESMPKWMYETPSLLVTAEINGHGNSLLLMDNMNLNTAGNVDLLECSGAGGFNFVDIKDLSAPVMADRWGVPVYFPTTNEIGAKVDGTTGQAISIGHTVGIDSTLSDKYICVADGPHGVSAWKIVDDAGMPTDNVHLVANTLQDEYPETAPDGTVIYPLSHATKIMFDPDTQAAWAGSNSNGMRRFDASAVEAGLGKVGAPLLVPLSLTDIYEHNASWGTVKGLQYQDHAYDVKILGNYAYLADGNNGLTIYDITKDSTDRTGGFVVANLGAGSTKPPFGTATGIDLWTDPSTGDSYAFIAAGARGIGVADVTDPANPQIVKVFEPIKLEDGKVGAADGKAVDVKVIGDYVYYTYDSFGVVAYSLADLITPVPAGVDPLELWSKSSTGQLLFDNRPEAVGRFKLQNVAGYESWAGGAVTIEYTQVHGKTTLYVPYGEAGVLKINWSDPVNPVLEAVAQTVGDCTELTISNGRMYVADGVGGLVFFK